jgi:hypothetical protein
LCHARVALGRCCTTATRICAGKGRWWTQLTQYFTVLTSDAGEDKWVKAGIVGRFASSTSPKTIGVPGNLGLFCFFRESGDDVSLALASLGLSPPHFRQATHDTRAVTNSQAWWLPRDLIAGVVHALSTEHFREAPGSWPLTGQFGSHGKTHQPCWSQDIRCYFLLEIWRSAVGVHS